ncbi:MAG TPA: hypothetical protein VF329_06720 [Gammaproteobacteria bacterium]
MTGRDKLAAAFLAADPDGAARLLETLPSDDAATLVAPCEPHAAARLFARMLPGYTARCIERLEPAQVAEIVERMDSQDAIAVLRQLAPAARARLLAALRPQWSAAFELLLRYPPSAVGAWAEPFALTLPADCTIAEARERIERNERTARARIYVLDRARRVRGAVRGLALLRHAGSVRLSAVLEPASPLWARETVADALERELWERDPEAPVVTRDHEFLGAVSYADLRRALRRQSRAEPSAGPRQGLTELAELLATGAGGLWESFGELVQPRSR